MVSDNLHEVYQKQYPLRALSFNQEMMEALKSGRKTVTRRLIKNQPETDWQYQGWLNESTYQWLTGLEDVSQQHLAISNYRAGDVCFIQEYEGMPLEFATEFIKIIKIDVQRIQDISVEDCILEGFPITQGDGHNSPYDWFKKLWSGIYGVENWMSNPFVWVYQFERCEKP